MTSLTRTSGDASQGLTALECFCRGLVFRDPTSVEPPGYSPPAPQKSMELGSVSLPI